MKKKAISVISNKTGQAAEKKISSDIISNETGQEQEA
jgi:hypothetical protein